MTDFADLSQTLARLTPSTVAELLVLLSDRGSIRARVATPTHPILDSSILRLEHLMSVNFGLLLWIGFGLDLGNRNSDSY
jgi:hypothetical protein